MNEILKLEQMEKMSIEEIVSAYQNGYRLSENHEIKTLQRYTWSDAGIISVAIIISTGLLGLLTYYIIRREEKRIVNDIKESIIGTIAKQGPTLIDTLAPLAQRVAERFAPAR